MRRVLVLVGLCSLCGCDALFGLDSLDYTPDARSDTQPDAARVTVTGRAVRNWLHNDEAGAPIFEPVAFTAAAPVTVHLADGSVAATTWDPASGVFTFEAGLGERYAVTYDTSIGSYEYQVATPTVAIQDTWLGHPDQITPGASSAIEWTSPTSGLSMNDLRFVTSGVWTIAKPTSPTTDKFTVSWPLASKFGGQQPALLDAAAHDALYILHYTPVATTPSYGVLDRYAPLTNTSLAPNAATPYSAPLQMLARAHCTDIHWRRSTEYAELAKYTGFGNAGGSTQLFALAGPETGYRVPFELASLTSTTDGNVAINYTNPFPGYATLILENNFLQRVTTGNTTLSVNTQYFDLITPTTSCTRYDDPPLPPFVTAPTLGGIPLADDVVIGLDTSKPIDLRWTPGAEQAPVTQVNFVQGTNLVRVYFTTDNTIRIDPALLAPNTSYRFVIVPVRGHYPNAADGDFVTRTYPIALSVLMTGFFKVVKN